MTCVCCRQEADDLRGGVCWDCATDGEREAAGFSVLRHLWEAARRLPQPRRWWAARISVAWAWDRLTRTGYYAPGGIFEREYGREALKL